MASAIEIAWAAGLFEGEGTISIAKRTNPACTTELGRTICVIGLKTTDKDVIERFARAVGCGKITESRWYVKNGFKPQWRWDATTNNQKAEFISLLYPYMGERRKQKMDEARQLLSAKYDAAIERRHGQLKFDDGG